MREALQAVPTSLWEGLDPNTTRWLPVILVSQSGLWLGLDQNGDWVVGRRGGRTLAGKPVTPAWLPVLDSDPSVLAEEIVDVAERHDLPRDELMQTLPIDETITLALNGESRHWVERAVAWLSTRDPNRDQVALLARVAEARWVDQRTRHDALRLTTARGGTR